MAQLSREATVVRAAGGVPCRRAPGSGAIEVLLVHRPKYDDWTFPKGKVGRGETEPEAALREVAEETGLRCRLGEELATTRYHDRTGRRKVVRYWVMEPEEGRFRPNQEVDEVRWVPVDEAAEALTYPRDRDVLSALERR